MLLILACQPAWAFGPKGHRLVGTIADRLLAPKPQAVRINQLLEGLTLADAAVIPDDIKNWNHEPDPQLPWTMKPGLRQEMIEFLVANSNSGDSHGHNHDHHGFHYTDISVVGDLKYASNKVGATRTDVVHMINVCIRVLKDPHPAPNQYKITPRVAVILLAHYVGDIHQPLHVGAVYFDADGNKVDPDVDDAARADNGGNDIQMHPNGLTTNTLSLHSFWDGNAVNEAAHQIKRSLGNSSPSTNLLDHEIDAHFVNVPPTGGPLDQNVPLLNLSTVWANEMLPIARQAHERLTLTAFPQPLRVDDKHVYSWKAVEAEGTSSYTEFAGSVVDKSIHRAGWRLAILLEKLF
jgi:hypothetical protein